MGKVDLLNLHPLSFREYLYAVNENSLSDALLTKDFSLIDGFAEKYIYHFKNYYYVGGMPEVVKNFALHGDYNEVRQIQKNILVQYKGDFGKHAGANELPRINMVWDSIPMQLAKENRIVPIEVKAETNVRSQSLKAFYEKYKPELSVRFSLLPYKQQDWMVNIPLYAVCLV